MFMLGPYFALSSIRVIVSSVSKTEFNPLENFHLTIPHLLCIALFPLNHYFFGIVNEIPLYYGLIALGTFNTMWFTVHTIA